jgi:hypothetical protein
MKQLTKCGGRTMAVRSAQACTGVRLEFVASLLILVNASAVSWAAGEKVTSPAVELPRQEGSFEQRRDPVRDDTPGVLKGGGYCWRPVLVTQRFYRALGRESGGATVETVAHESDYPYVIHDFFGTFFGAGVGSPLQNGSKIVDGIVKSGAVEWRFVTWVSENGPSGTICTNVFRKTQESYAGLVGWYSRGSNGLTTVMMFFSKLDGVPAELIDKYLREYPSSVRPEQFHSETWVAHDVRKWIHLLALHKGKPTMFGMAGHRLMAYDRGLFGIEPLRLESDDPDVFRKAIEDLKLHAEHWLQNREQEKGGPGNP